MTRKVARLSSVVFWCLPTYVAVATTFLLAPKAGNHSFRRQLALSDILMLVAALLPITTIIGGFKASGVPLRADDNRLQVWRPLVAWCVVAFALVLNLVGYKVIADTLR